MSKLYKSLAKNPEKKGWDSKGGGGGYPDEICQEDLCYIHKEASESALNHSGELH